MRDLQTTHEIPGCPFFKKLILKIKGNIFLWSVSRFRITCNFCLIVFRCRAHRLNFQPFACSLSWQSSENHKNIEPSHLWTTNAIAVVQVFLWKCWKKTILQQEKDETQYFSCRPSQDSHICFCIGSDSYHKCLCPFLSFCYNSPSN